MSAAGSVMSRTPPPDGSVSVATEPPALETFVTGDVVDGASASAGTDCAGTARLRSPISPDDADGFLPLPPNTQALARAANAQTPTARLPRNEILGFRVMKDDRRR